MKTKKKLRTDLLKKPQVIAVIILLVFLSILVFFKSGIVSYIILENMTVPQQELNLNIDQSQEYPSNIETYLELFNLNSVILFGEVTGTGNFSIYLKDNKSGDTGHITGMYSAA